MKKNKLTLRKNVIATLSKNDLYRVAGGGPNLPTTTNPDQIVSAVGHACYSGIECTSYQQSGIVSCQTHYRCEESVDRCQA